MLTLACACGGVGEIALATWLWGVFGGAITTFLVWLGCKKAKKDVNNG